MDKVYDVKNFKVTKETISFELSNDSVTVRLNNSGSKILPQADLNDLQNFELDNSGIGIHWPTLDEDLSVEGLLHSADRQDLIVEHKLPNWYQKEPSVKAS